jgi:dTDP-4-dehydrorhamnose 3,5-epimerase
MVKTPAKTIQGAFVFTPTIHRDTRGFFLEAWNEEEFRKAVGDPFMRFVQDNHSQSNPNVLRGLHYQAGEAAQGKLVWVSSGSVLDIIVDLRKKSPSFGKWESFNLHANNQKRLWVPPGCAHGYCVTSTTPADFHYKVTTYRSPTAERTLLWNDPTMNIKWGCSNPIISEKDALGKRWESAEVYETHP